MAVKLDSSAFKARIFRLQRELSSVSPSSIPDYSARTIAGYILNKYKYLANNTYRFDTQVGITPAQFNTAIDGVDRLGDSHYGILSLRRMGTESDISQIANIPGLWHQGHNAFDSFRIKVLGNPTAISSLKSLRDAYWGIKVPQWIFLEYGDDGKSGEITPPAGALSIAKEPKSIWRRWHNTVKDRLRSARI